MIYAPRAARRRVSAASLAALCMLGATACHTSKPPQGGGPGSSSPSAGSPTTSSRPLGTPITASPTAPSPTAASPTKGSPSGGVTMRQSQQDGPPDASLPPLGAPMRPVGPAQSLPPLPGTGS